MSALIVLIMLLTFLNLVVVTGVLTGLPFGAKEAYRLNYAGDILLSTPEGKRFIEQSQSLKRSVDTLPEVSATSARYVSLARLEANYQDTRAGDEVGDVISVQIAGVNPDDEAVVTALDRSIIAGEFLRAGDTEGVVISKELLADYDSGSPIVDTTLEDVAIGDKIRISVEGNTREFILRGVLGTKAQVVNRRALVLDSRLREMLNRFDSNVNEIAVRLHSDADAASVRRVIQSMGAASGVKAELAYEALGQFLTDIEDTFTILGNGIGVIGLVVAAITIFIVIFINAITRRRYIGILKGIGIGGLAIEFAYVVQALVYVLIGASLGLLLTYQVLVPYVMENPINFPFSDGILLAPFDATMVRMLLLIITTVIAGYVPAKMITRQNTLDAILGR